MTRKQWMLLVFALVLTGMSLYLNRDWFASKDIQIYHRSSPRPVEPKRNRPDTQGPSAPITFGFDRKLRLTDLRVIPLYEIQTNKYPHPIWHMSSSSNSVPVNSFNYGGRIPGMHPSVKGALPEPLLPGTQYRLLVQAGKIHLEHDFEPIPRWR